MYVEAGRYALPNALWNRPPGDIRTRQGLPYALLFLVWEARYPQEWTRHAKKWDTKQSPIRDVAVADHGRLETAVRSDNSWARRHAGYVLWLLDRPEVPNTIHVWQSWIAAEARG